MLDLVGARLVVRAVRLSLIMYFYSAPVWGLLLLWSAFLSYSFQFGACDLLFDRASLSARILGIGERRAPAVCFTVGKISLIVAPMVARCRCCILTDF